MNLANMMKQAQQMQKKLQDAQSELASAEFKAASGDEAVVVICDGQGKFKSIKLSKMALNPENPDSVDEDTVEMLEDLITTAMNQATSQATKEMESKMKSLTGGISIPGLF
jgi:DNA-binding YbaB/EbfC family protein